MAAEYAYPSDLDSDEGSIGGWSDDEADGSNESDGDGAHSLASRMSGMRLNQRHGSQKQQSRSQTAASGATTLCMMCRAKPKKRGYPTCSLVCAGQLQEIVDELGGLPDGASGSRRRRSSDRRSSLPGGSSSAVGGLSGNRNPPCIICKRRPSFEDRVTCGLKCAENLALKGGDSTMCNYCHRRPKIDNHLQCGQTCADKAKNACLLCRCRPRNGRYHLCGKLCRGLSVKQTPLLLEAHKGHSTFDMVEKKFKKAWQAGSTPCPGVKRVFKIIENDDFLRPYNAYRTRVKNEHFRYHGTRKLCNLGSGSTQVCASSACAICSILKSSFKTSLANPGGAFGAGVYTSSASNKSFSYCGTGGVMLLTKVVLGKVRNVTQWNEVMSCPPGFDSVEFDRNGGALNETIVYSDDAIRPVFLIVF
ncbi:ADP-ribosylation [Coprinopsis marcescibilis]|uniref:ADP-ribosylation n=1 Tax=Coprinopsis marcescibilis TaxID=230819 RepID=A0A5C3KJZ3_COPMA|nr:ADP-ribosylation [Coprinopsis marcescibilis]